MKLKSLLFKLLFVPVLLGLTATFVASCSDDDEVLQGGTHGYVQFKLYKEASAAKAAAASRAENTELEYLNDAKKIKVLLSNGGAVASYTLSLSAYDEENAEYGLRSDKLQLTAGAYELVGYYLYGKVENEILAGEPAEKTVINVQKGGLTVQDVLVKAVARGKVRFHLVKDLSAVMPQSRSSEVTQYPLSMVATARIQLTNTDTKETVDLQKLDVSYEESYRDDMTGTSYAVVDSLCTIPAGTYKVDMVYTYPKSSSSAIEVGQVSSTFTFEVKDNQDPEKNIVNVPITLQKSAEYIKDYVALREIWEQMDGKNWSYSGESYARGRNWDFNKDIDMWGDQPGVTVNNEGRVTSLAIGDFGPTGEVPGAIGQLTALQTLALGTHNDKLNASVPSGTAAEDKAFYQALLNPTSDNREKLRNDYMDRYASHDLLSGLSEPLKWGLKQKGTQIREKSGIATFDVAQGELTNGITGISEEIGKLENLEIIYIANSKIAELPASMEKLTKVTDMEVYNNPLMKKFPEVLAKMPGLIQLNLAMNRQWTSEEINKGVKLLCEGAAKEELQILYLGYNNLTELPATVSNLKKLTKIDCVYNQLTSLPSFTQAVGLVQATFDYNQITAIPENFCGIEDVESISFSHNKIKELPKGFFNPKSVFIMKSVDFSYNEITEVPSNYGCNVDGLSLAGNKLTVFPKGLFEGGSSISTLNLAGNRISKFEKGDIVGEKSYMLSSIDLTYNELTKFPEDFNAVNVPYLYGVDVSYNRFDAFPFEPLDASGLTVLGVRYQRDADGNRCLTEWPTGISKHVGLRGLFLGGNDIGNVNVGKEESISYLIYNLDIADNPNIVINLSEVCAYIQAGIYVLYYDSTQDIRGCDALDLD